MADFKIADGYVEVHLREDFDKELMQRIAASGAGTKAGERVGRNINKGIEKTLTPAEVRVEVDKASLDRARTAVEGAEKAMTRARDSHADAIKAADVAEKKLGETRENVKAKASSVAGAELQLERAKRRVAAAADAARDAETRLAAARDRALAVGNGQVMPGIPDTTAAAGASGTRSGNAYTAGFERATGRNRLGLAAKAALATLPAAGLAAGALMGAGIAAAGTAITGLGVLLLREDARITQAYGNMAERVTRSARTSAQALVPDLVAIAGDIEREFNAIDLDSLFENAGPQARIFAGGLLDLASNAIPGVTTALRDGREEAEGFASFLGSAGSGIGGFFTEISKGGENTRLTLVALGDVVETVLTNFGSALTFLSEASSGFAQDFVPAIKDVLDFGGQLGSGFFPTLIAAAGGALDVLSGLTGVLGPVAPLLGGIGAAALVGAAGLRVFEAANRMLTRTTGGVAAYGAASQKTARQTGSLVSRVGAFASFLGGPVGIGIGVATLGLGFLGDAMQENAQRAQAIRDRVAGLRDVVAQSGGVITAQTRAFIDQTVAAGGLANGLRDAGITSDMLTRAIEGQSGSMAVVDEAYQQMIARSLETNGIFSEETTSLIRQADEYRQLTKARKEAAEAAAAQSAAMRDSTGYMFQTAQSVQELSAAFAKYGADAGDATTNLAALQGIVRGTAPELSTVADAQQTWNDRLRSMNEEIKGGIDKTDGFGKSLLNADRSLNTVSENGSKLRNFLTGAREDMVTLGKSVFDESQRMGDSVETSSQKARDALEGQRKAALDVAKAFGITGKDADDLLRTMNLFPDEIVSKIRLAGATDLTRELAGIDAQLDRVRPGVPVRVTALTQDAVGKLTELGFKVEQLEDDSWQITADDTQARGKLDEFLKAADAGLLKPKQLRLETDRAREELAAFSAWAIDGTDAYVEVNGDVTKGYEALEIFQQAAWDANPFVQISADPTGGYQALDTFISTADRSWAAPEIEANTAPGTADVGAFLGWAEAAWAAPEIGANTGPGVGSVSGFLGWADSAWADTNIGADAGAAYGTLSGVLSAINRSRATITIGARYVGPTTRAADYYGGAGAATGGVLGFGPGGVQAYDSGGIMPGYTPGRDVHRFVSPTGGQLLLSGGEAVMRPEWTAGMGRRYVQEANAAARRGQVRQFLAAQAMGAVQTLSRGQAFSSGGVVGAPAAPVSTAAPSASAGVSIDYDQLADAVARGMARVRMLLDNRSGPVMAQIVANRQLANAGR